MKLTYSPIVLLAIAFLLSCNSEKKPVVTDNSSPLLNLPDHIRQVTHFGQRADWSHDGKKILFLEKTFGDLYEVNLETGVIRSMSHHFFHEGFTRALYLANGDIILSGARSFDATDPWPSRDQENAELWVLSKDLNSPPVPLGEHCSEGPAVSRKNMNIAWAFRNDIYKADLSDSAGIPILINKQKILEGDDLGFECYLETQNFRPPDEKEITLSAYEYQGSEVLGLDIESGEVINYTNAPNSYEEPEGIFPDGRFTLVEGDRHHPEGIQFIDIYKLALDGSGESERITFFSEFEGYKATNPVVSDDGKFMAFQVAYYGDPAGVGRGILIFDFEKYKR
jgi:hypothetical protein